MLLKRNLKRHLRRDRLVTSDLADGLMQNLNRSDKMNANGKFTGRWRQVQECAPVHHSAPLQVASRTIKSSFWKEASRFWSV
jgi:hypothetical protein